MNTNSNSRRREFYYNDSVTTTTPEPGPAAATTAAFDVQQQQQHQDESPHNSIVMNEANATASIRACDPRVSFLDELPHLPVQMQQQEDTQKQMHHQHQLLTTTKILPIRSATTPESLHSKIPTTVSIPLSKIIRSEQSRRWNPSNQKIVRPIPVRPMDTVLNYNDANDDSIVIESHHHHSNDEEDKYCTTTSATASDTDNKNDTVFGTSDINTSLSFLVNFYENYEESATSTDDCNDDCELRKRQQNQQQNQQQYCYSDDDDSNDNNSSNAYIVNTCLVGHWLNNERSKNPSPPETARLSSLMVDDSADVSNDTILNNCHNNYSCDRERSDTYVDADVIMIGTTEQQQEDSTAAPAADNNDNESIKTTKTNNRHPNDYYSICTDDEHYRNTNSFSSFR